MRGDYIKQVAFAYNTSVHASTGYTPYFLTHEREAHAPVDVLVSPPGPHSDLSQSYGDSVSVLMDRLNAAFNGTGSE